MTNISLEAQAKRAFFEPLRFTSVSCDYKGVKCNLIIIYVDGQAWEYD